LAAGDASLSEQNVTNQEELSGNEVDARFPVNFTDATVDGGKKCIQKVMMVYEKIWEYFEECDHSYDRRCHMTTTTKFQAQQEEECNENYKKNCYITYDKVAFNTTVDVCRNPLEKVEGCVEDKSNERVCRTVFESECSTRQNEHEVVEDVVSCTTEEEEVCEEVSEGYTTETKCQKWPRNVCKVAKQKVKKYAPITSCEKIPKELCGPVNCGYKEGAEVCSKKVQTIVQETPAEECSLEPQTVCNFVTKMVPRLEPMEECVDVPKEVCTRSRRNPKEQARPVIKKWCYTPNSDNVVNRSGLGLEHNSVE